MDPHGAARRREDVGPERRALRPVAWPAQGGIGLERYDLIIIGGGAAGINALKAAVTLAARVVLVDRGPLGGTCVNRG